MPNKPTVGSNDGTWGTVLNAFLDVGHDSDGTHTKSQMLTDMNWSPTSVGSTTRSVTFPNGLIVKWGQDPAGSLGAKTFVTTYGNTDFPNDCYGVNISMSSSGNANPYISAYSKTGFTLAGNAGAFFWIALGY